MAKMHQNGDWFREKRNLQRLTQQQVAALIGKDRSYIAQIENGHRWPTEPVLYSLLDALDVPPAEAIDQLDLVKNDEVEQVLRFVEFLEEVQSSIPQERLQEFREFFVTRNELLSVVASLANGEKVPPGPEGWYRLHTEDRRLVQRLVNRILTSTEYA